MSLPEHLTALAARVSNRGRWGPDDQRGTLNLITPEVVRRGLAAARQGRVFSLAIPFDEQGPQHGSIPGRDNPRREMVMVHTPLTGDPDDFCTSDDRLTMGVQAATHWDALCHVGYGGELYNGTSSAVVGERGASRLGIEHVGAVVSRGLMLDVARALGVNRFDDGYPITGDDLDRAAALGGLEVRPGDICCVRTGHMSYWRDGDIPRFHNPSPGLSTASIEWIRDHDVAAVATDTVVFECYPGDQRGVLLPVHMIHLRDMGLAQGQLWDLDELAADCAADGQHDFLLTATPLPLTGSPGGPVAPTAVK
ncbi:MAG: putative cyclase [Acidimicrobiales bacterium]|nr:putative cyclase [Acidimicrobiales bacterium]